jgi:3-methyl-2-oxobutanoate hydroxymethyltransferase
VQAAGAFAIVLELVPTQLAQLITERLHIPTIGIGAGMYCDGQVQVFHDILALYTDFLPRHAKRYAQIGDLMREAIEKYCSEVIAGHFPAEANSFTMSEEVIESLRHEVAQRERA